jgi:hypothetical protein
VSAQDPSAELWELVRGIESGAISEKAITFCDGAFDTSDAILAKIEEMDRSGRSGPTPDQQRALRNIYTATCRWLGRKPELSQQSREGLTLERNRVRAGSTGTVYGDTSSGLFHRGYCHVRMAAQRPQREFDSALRAKDAGLRACDACCKGL